MADIPTYPITWQQGEDGVLSINYKEANVSVDLTNYSVRMDVRNDAGTNLFVFNSEDIASEALDQPGAADNEATLGSDGSINIVVPRAATLGAGPLVESIGTALKYDVFLRNKTTNKQRKILKGTIIIEPSQTRWL